MKDHALQLVAAKEGFNAKLNAMREYLQAYTLKILHGEGWFRTEVFVGGTALRFLYDLPRFSEDLDFSAVKNPEKPFVDFVSALKGELTAAGYTVEISYSDKKAVQYAMIKFKRLMYEARLSPHRDHTFSIKLETDTKPPAGAAVETQAVHRHFPMVLLTYDRSSLFAGKCHALLARKYTKGRDFFDLGWYLSRWKGLAPNIQFLRNALKQTDWAGEVPTESNWRKFLRGVVETTDWKKVTRDIENFLENPKDLDVFTQANVLKLLADPAL